MGRLFKSKVFSFCLLLSFLFLLLSFCWYYNGSLEVSYFDKFVIYFALPISTTVVGAIISGLILLISTGLYSQFSESKRRDTLNNGIKAYQSKQYVKARKLLTSLAKLGYAEAQNYLGMVYGRMAKEHISYAEYLGGEKSKYVENMGNLSRDWYIESARQGYVNAVLNLGWLYKDIFLDDVKSYMWFTIARDKHGYNTQDELDRLKKQKKISPSDIKKAQKMARRCIESDYTDFGED